VNRPTVERFDFKLVAVASISAQTGKQAARIDQLRFISGCAALAFPTDVGAARARDGGDKHVSGQQPVAPRAALGWSVHPLGFGRTRAAHLVAEVDTHEHHPSIGAAAEPVRCANRYSALQFVTVSLFPVPAGPVQLVWTGDKRPLGHPW
jgi:hypothetical protein